MRKNRSFLFIVSILLLLVTAFSFSSAVLPHRGECAHSVCEYCEELEQAEQHLQEAIRTHGECDEASCCEFCAFIRTQRTYLQSKHSEGHICRTEICFSCVLNVLSRRIRSFMAALAALLSALAVFAPFYYSVAKPSFLSRKVTLIELKVKLTD